MMTTGQAARAPWQEWQATVAGNSGRSAWQQWQECMATAVLERDEHELSRVNINHTCMD
jgi:hypothetical protein